MAVQNSHKRCNFVGSIEGSEVETVGINGRAEQPQKVQMWAPQGCFSQILSVMPYGTPMDLGPDWGPTVIIIALVGITSHHWKSSKGLPYNPLVVLDKPDLSLKRILKERKTRGGVKEFWTSQSRLNP
ncbi:hypothetical protein B0H14DRAFT_2583844 [Mycena olivaceomarginata]|jgi:hypothetical protein|nr:hypothetical protein B0H14DRAFT_2583844 [Mycena olivaceomarginata]